jgi:predicted dehydrogenase
MKVAIIGCGLIGHKRAKSLPEGIEIAGCYDTDSLKAKSFEAEFKTKSFSNLEKLLSIQDLVFVIIATTHDALCSSAVQALNAGKHVFIEKPGAININQLKELYNYPRPRELKIHIGYNHAYFPAFVQAFKIFNEGAIGELMFLRGSYGHGGRIGYENEWRADKEKSGGGELIDQGSHLIELALHFLGPAKVEYAATPSYFWQMNVEDNVFMALVNKNGNLAFLHASCTEWKNMFSFEIYCKNGKIDISGLGNSYGIQTLTLHKMKPEMGPPISETWEFPDTSYSWRMEMKQFVDDIVKDEKNSDNLSNALEVLEIIDEIYEKTER